MELLQNLPSEILYYILSTLSLKDLVNTCHTSLYFYHLCKDEFLWKRLMYYTYGVRDKIHSEETWYQNCTYISKLFNSTQLSIIEKIRNYTEQLNLLKCLHTYTQYSDLTYLDYAYVDFPLDNVIICIVEAPIVNTAFITARIQDSTNSSYLVTLNVFDGDLTSCDALTSNTHIIDEVYNKGTHVDIVGTTTEYYALINREQLVALSHMFV